MDADFSNKLVFGQNGERLVVELLHDKFGSFCHRLHEDYPAAPKSQGHILPDLVLWENKGKVRQQMWLGEVKTKQQWVRWRGSIETGLEERKFRQYAQLSRKTGIKLWFFFLHIIDPPLGLWCCSSERFFEMSRLWDGRSKKTGRSVLGINEPMRLIAKEYLTQIADREFVLRAIDKGKEVTL